MFYLFPRLVLTFFTLLLLAVISLSGYANDQQLPDLGSSARVGITPQTEEMLALSFVETLYRYTNINDDPELNDYITGIGLSLLRHIRTSRHYRFYLINDNNINAFAGPGGIIGVNTGLIMAAKSEDEIAAVLAHEIQHVEQDHILRMFEQQKQGLLPTIASVLGALIIGSQNPQAGMAIMTGSIAYQMEEQLGFSRDNEWEADRLGIDLLNNTGYDPNAMADFFETLANRYTTTTKTSELLQTHPVTDKRISDSRAKARLISRKKNLHNPLNLRLAQARLEAITQQVSTQTDTNILCYQQQVTQMMKQLAIPSCSLNIKHPWIESLTLQKTTSPDSLSTHWQKLLQLYPQQLSLWLNYANYLFEHHDYTTVINALQTQIDVHNNTFALWELIAKSYHALGNEASSAFALSKAYASIGELKLSKIQLERAKSNNEINEDISLSNKLEIQTNYLEKQEKLRKTLE